MGFKTKTEKILCPYLFLIINLSSLKSILCMSAVYFRT